MPLAPREVDAIFSACDVTASPLRPTIDQPSITQPTPPPSITPPPRPPDHPRTNPATRWTATAPSTGPSLRRRSGRRCRSRRSGKGTSGKAAEAIQASKGTSIRCLALTPFWAVVVVYFSRHARHPTRFGPGVGERSHIWGRCLLRYMVGTWLCDACRRRIRRMVEGTEKKDMHVLGVCLCVLRAINLYKCI